jgi:ABC-2 type transport system ATP-binding protein
MSESNVIEVENLNKVFTDFWGRKKAHALKDINLNISESQVFALLGPNGSGKTTFIKILLGLLAPTKGSANIFGDSIFKTSNKSRIGLLPEASYFYENLTGIETLNFYAKLLGLPKNVRKERIDYLLDLTEMTSNADRQVGDYSQGMQRRIGIAQALLADPELLILDEPTNGLDPLAIDKVHQLILQLKEEGKTILICTHLLSETESICDNLAILHEGNILAKGNIADLYTEHDCDSMKSLFHKVINSATEPQEDHKSDDDYDHKSEEPNEAYLEKLTKP